MVFEDIKLNVEKENVLVVTIDRVEVYNALRDNTLKEIAIALKDCKENIKCVILTGGENIFAAGADINELEAKGTVQSINDIRATYWEIIKDFKKPLIAAVNGFCLGGGFELAMHCDIIISGDTAQFGQPEINLGIMPGAGGTQRSVRSMGKSNAMLMLLTGSFMDAKSALKMGVVSEVVPAKTTILRAIEIAVIISSKSTLAVSAIKSAVLASFDSGLTSSLKYEKTLFSGLLSSDDKKEGIKAFKEKRKPNFRGQ